MTDITDRPTVEVEKTAEPVDLVKPEQPVEQAEHGSDRPRRRVRIDSLRRVFVEARQHPTYRFSVRHGSYMAGGTRILARRTWEARTTAMHHRMMRAAEIAGNEEMAQKWEQRAYAYRFARHKRRVDLLQMVINLPKALFQAAVATIGGLLLLGILLAWANHNVSDVIAPLNAFVQLVGWLAFLASVIWDPFLYSLPLIALAGVWSVGRNARSAPTWALPIEGDDRDVVPDENAIMRALENLNLPPLNKALKEGWKARWVQPSTRSGNGYHAQLQLPMGVTVEMISGKKTVLAHNLMRKPIEVWPTEPPKQPGILDLWVADQGSLSGAIPDWPLLHEGTTDYFKGVPVAVSQRGEPIVGQLMGKNYLVGGIMGSGKSSLIISLLLGAVLDPIVEAEVYVMAYNVDYDPLKPRLRTLVKGDDDEDIEAAVNALRRLRDEVSERGRLLESMGGETTKLNRELALRDPRMRPKIVVFDECHELFMHKKYGKEAGELAEKVIKKARKCGITLVFVTVSPTADSIPKELTRNTSHNVAFAVGDYVANDGLLGTGKHKAGITATTLIPGEDIGTAVTTGFSKKPFEVVRCHYIARDPEKNVDQVTPAVERAMALYEGTGPMDAPAFAPVDHLADIAAVLGHEPRMRTQDVLRGLQDINAAEYGSWSFRDLKRVLDEAGHGDYKTGGKMHVSLDRVLEAIAGRDEDDVDDEGGTED